MGDKAMTLLKKGLLSTLSHKAVGAASRRRAPRLSLRDQAYEAIKDRIITCQFQPGACINEASVSALLGFGRTPVHQAIDRLMLEEMVDVIPRKGVIVRPVILQDVMQMIEVRMVNETQCARLAAVRAEQSHIEGMSAVIAKATRAIDKQDVHSLMELDREFHLLLANATKNFELTEIIRRLNERSLRFWFISFTTPDHHQSFQRQHEALFEAVRSHDADDAEDAMRVHIEAFRKSVARQL
jgi:DNA-binding GntR family transcriptional regulator